MYLRRGIDGWSYRPTPITTAQRSYCGTAAGGAGGAATDWGASKNTVRTSWRTVPSPSVALIATTLTPGCSFSGTVTSCERCGVLSLGWFWSSTPLSVTATRATPLLEETTAAATLAASLTRIWSWGKRIATVRGTGRS